MTCAVSDTNLATSAEIISRNNTACKDERFSTAGTKFASLSVHVYFQKYLRVIVQSKIFLSKFQNSWSTGKITVFQEVCRVLEVFQNSRVTPEREKVSITIPWTN